MSIALWEILVPGNYAPVYHREWDAMVAEITGGLTIGITYKGVWKDQEYCRESVISVRIAASLDQMKQIAALTAKHYKQEAVMYYKVSEEVYITKFKE